MESRRKGGDKSISLFMFQLRALCCRDRCAPLLPVVHISACLGHYWTWLQKGSVDFCLLCGSPLSHVKTRTPHSHRLFAVCNPPSSTQGNVCTDEYSWCAPLTGLLHPLTSSHTPLFVYKLFPRIWPSQAAFVEGVGEPNNTRTPAWLLAF